MSCPTGACSGRAPRIKLVGARERRAPPLVSGGRVESAVALAAEAQDVMPTGSLRVVPLVLAGMVMTSAHATGPLGERPPDRPVTLTTAESPSRVRR